MKSGMGRPDRDAEDLGDPVERQIEVVVQHHHCAMIDGKVAEPSFELIAIDDRAQVVSSDRLVGWEQPQIRRPAPLLPALAVAGTNEEPVRPSLEAGWVAKLRKVLPDGQQRLLRRVLGEIHVAEDPSSDGQESIGESSRMSVKTNFIESFPASGWYSIRAGSPLFGSAQTVKAIRSCVATNPRRRRPSNSRSPSSFSALSPSRRSAWIIFTKSSLPFWRFARSSKLLKTTASF